MTRLYRITVRVLVVFIWVFLAYVVIDWAGQQIEFHKAMGGMF